MFRRVSGVSLSRFWRMAYVSFKSGGLGYSAYRRVRLSVMSGAQV
jgi:hypothetical protein